jgi:hypothetical protein
MVIGGTFFRTTLVTAKEVLHINAAATMASNAAQGGPDLDRGDKVALLFMAAPVNRN